MGWYNDCYKFSLVSLSIIGYFLIVFALFSSFSLPSTAIRKLKIWAGTIFEGGKAYFNVYIYPTYGARHRSGEILIGNLRFSVSLRRIPTRIMGKKETLSSSACSITLGTHFEKALEGL